MRGKVLAIAGCTNAGKSTLARRLAAKLADESPSLVVRVVHQDDFYRDADEARVVRAVADSSLVYRDFEAPSTINEAALCDALSAAAVASADVTLLDGIAITELPNVYARCDRLLFITIDKETCRRRRERRDDYDPADLPGYFEEMVWPAYEGVLRNVRARADPLVTLIDAHDSHLADIATRVLHEMLDEHLAIETTLLDCGRCIEFVTSAQCGGISVFVGTTRDTFDGKRVRKLCYEHYGGMAHSELRRLCARARRAHPSLGRIALVHCVGEVPVAEASVIVATSAPHRDAAIDATRFLIDELKRRVPIWKKEVYEDGSTSWK